MIPIPWFVVVTDQLIEKWSSWSNIGLTFGLLVFAGMQWYVTHMAEKARKREREQDLRRELDAAYAVVRATWFDVWAYRKRLEAMGDLERHAAEGLFRPDSVLPPTPLVVTEAAAKLGALTSQLTVAGLRFLADAAEVVYHINKAVERHNRLDIFKFIERHRYAIDEAEKHLDDAVHQCEAAHIDRALDFYGEPRSDLGKVIAEKSGHRSFQGTRAATGDRPADLTDSPKPI